MEGLLQTEQLLRTQLREAIRVRRERELSVLERISGTVAYQRNQLLVAHAAEDVALIQNELQSVTKRIELLMGAQQQQQQPQPQPPPPYGAAPPVCSP